MVFHLLPMTFLLFLLLSSPNLALPANDYHGGHEAPLVRMLYEYPEGTWLENIAIRESGELVITHLEKPQLDQFNPLQQDAEPEVVYTFMGYLAASGIAEIAPDSFTVAVGNFTFTGGGLQGSWGIWDVAFGTAGNSQASVDEIGPILEANFPDGMCKLPSSGSPNDILYGDIKTGVIWHFDATTGTHEVVLNNTLTAAATDPIFGASGVNGMHVVDGILYFVNTAKGLFVSVPVDPNGTPTGDATIIYQSNQSEEVLYFDDFAIKGNDAYLVTGSGNSIERIGLDGTHKGRIIAGSLNSTQFAEPTSCAFGRTEKDSNILYVITAGGLAAPVEGNITVGAQILAVDTSRWEC